MRNGPKHHHSPRYIYRRVLRELQDFADVSSDHRVRRREGKMAAKRAAETVMYGVHDVTVMKGAN